MSDIQVGQQIAVIFEATRKHRNWSQLDLAKRANVPLISIAKLESNLAIPEEHVKMISQVLNFSFREVEIQTIEQFMEVGK